MVTVETISIVFTGLSISLAAFYYISTLRNAQRTQQMQLETRQAQLFMSFVSSEWEQTVMTHVVNEALFTNSQQISEWDYYDMRRGV